METIEKSSSYFASRMWPIVNVNEREGSLIISDCEIFIIQTARAEAGGWLLAGGGGCVVEVEDASNWCVS